MGITPITNLAPLSIARSIQADLDPLPMARIESSARTGDEPYSPSGSKSGRGSEDDATEDDATEDDVVVALASDGALEDTDEEISDESPVALSVESGPQRPVSFFA